MCFPPLRTRHLRWWVSSFAFDVRAYRNYAVSKLVFKSFLQVFAFSKPNSSFNVKKAAELNHPLSRRSCVEGRSVTITDEFRIASGYGSVWVVLLLGGDDACTHLVIRFCFRYSLNSAQRKEHCMLPGQMSAAQGAIADSRPKHTRKCA